MPLALTFHSDEEVGGEEDSGESIDGIASRYLDAILKSTLCKPSSSSFFALFLRLEFFSSFFAMKLSLVGIARD